MPASGTCLVHVPLGYVQNSKTQKGSHGRKVTQKVTQKSDFVFVFVCVPGDACHPQLLAKSAEENHRVETPLQDEGAKNAELGGRLEAAGQTMCALTKELSEKTIE